MKGYYQKYIIAKMDGSPVDPHADYFVLRLDTDEHARAVVRHYAHRIQSQNPLLAEELRQRVDVYWEKKWFPEEL